MAKTNFDALIKRIRESEQSLEDIATASGVPIGTLNKIVHGHTPNPRIRTVEKLERIFPEQGVAG